MQASPSSANTQKYRRGRTNQSFVPQPLQVLLLIVFKTLQREIGWAQSGQALFPKSLAVLIELVPLSNLGDSYGFGVFMFSMFTVLNPIFPIKYVVRFNGASSIPSKGD